MHFMASAACVFSRTALQVHAAAPALAKTCPSYQHFFLTAGACPGCSQVSLRFDMGKPGRPRGQQTHVVRAAQGRRRKLQGDAAAAEAEAELAVARATPAELAQLSGSSDEEAAEVMRAEAAMVQELAAMQRSGAWDETARERGLSGSDRAQ